MSVSALNLISNIAMFGMLVSVGLSISGPQPTLEKKIAAHNLAQLARIGTVVFSAIYLASMFAKEFAA